MRIRVVDTRFWHLDGRLGWRNQAARMNGAYQVVAAEEFAESESGTETIGYSGTVLPGHGEATEDYKDFCETGEEKGGIDESVLESVL